MVFDLFYLLKINFGSSEEQCVLLLTCASIVDVVVHNMAHHLYLDAVDDKASEEDVPLVVDRLVELMSHSGVHQGVRPAGIVLHLPRTSCVLLILEYLTPTRRNRKQH